MTPIVKFKRLSIGFGLPVPSRAHPGDAGLDLCAALDEEKVIYPGRHLLIPIGFKMELPPGHEAQIRPRSGLALKYGITVLNSPGTIDFGYSGPVAVILANQGSDPYVVRHGDRIAQMVIQRIPDVDIVEVEDEFEASARGSGGFGSTGLST